MSKLFNAYMKRQSGLTLKVTLELPVFTQQYGLPCTESRFERGQPDLSLAGRPIREDSSSGPEWWGYFAGAFAP